MARMRSEGVEKRDFPLGFDDVAVSRLSKAELSRRPIRIYAMQRWQ